MNLDSSLNTTASSDGQAQMDLITMMMQMEEKLTDFNDQLPPPPPSNYTNTPSTQPFYDAWSDATAVQMAAVASPDGGDERRSSSVAAMREMIFRIAAMQPINLDPEAVKPPKRRNVRISKDPQSVAARHRRERISERIRILQRLVPGGTKMDTASMLDEAVHYVKFLKTQLQSLERAGAAAGGVGAGVGFPPAAAMAAFANGSYSCTGRRYSAQDQGYMMNPSHHQMLS